MDATAKSKRKLIEPGNNITPDTEAEVMSTLDWASEIFNLIGEAQRTCTAFEYEKRERLAEALRRECSRTMGELDFPKFKAGLLKIWRGEYT